MSIVIGASTDFGSRAVIQAHILDHELSFRSYKSKITVATIYPLNVAQFIKSFTVLPPESLVCGLITFTREMAEGNYIL